MKNVLNTKNKVCFKNYARKFIVGGTLSLALLGGMILPMIADANSSNDTNTFELVSASRPLLMGSPRGTSRVDTRNGNSQAIQARAVVVNTNNTTTTPNTWQQRQNPNGSLSINTGVTSNETIGSTRGKTVRAEDRRRASSDGSWSTIIVQHVLGNNI